jgi:hypothetical protein
MRRVNFIGCFDARRCRDGGTTQRRASATRGLPLGNWNELKRLDAQMVAGVSDEAWPGQGAHQHGHCDVSHHSHGQAATSWGGYMSGLKIWRLMPVPASAAITYRAGRGDLLLSSCQILPCVQPHSAANFVWPPAISTAVTNASNGVVFGAIPLNNSYLL